MTHRRRHLRLVTGSIHRRNTISCVSRLNRLQVAISQAHLVAWDGCHKIYVALDDAAAESFRNSYDHIAEGSPERMLSAAADWWSRSCWLRFVTGVRDNFTPTEPQYVSLIAQCDDDFEEEVDEFFQRFTDEGWPS